MRSDITQKGYSIFNNLNLRSGSGFIQGSSSKKSQISIQFSWIFILIAGAIILLFFTSLVFKQKSISEEKISASVLNQLETILTGSGLSSGTVNIIDTPELELNFICDSDGYSEYSIKNTGLTKETPYDIIFAPEYTKGKKLITWALDFNAPFKVTNFLYISDPEIKYVLVNPENSDIGREVKRKLPETELSLQEVNSISQVNAEGYHDIRLIYFNEDPSGIVSWSEEITVSAVKISSGTVTFYKRQDSSLIQEGTSVPYLKIPSLIGAIFSKDLESYECTMKKALRKLSLVAKIYSDRESQLKDHFQSGSSVLGCELYYQEQITDMVSHSIACSDNIRICISNIISDVNNIESNQEILIRKTCPLLY